MEFLCLGGEGGQGGKTGLRRGTAIVIAIRVSTVQVHRMFVRIVFKIVATAENSGEYSTTVAAEPELEAEA